MFRDELFVAAVFSGIILLFLGFYYLKSDPNSWVRSSISGIEFPEWFNFLFAGTFFLVMAILVKIFFG